MSTASITPRRVVVRPAPPADHNRYARAGTPNFVAGIGRMWHATRLLAGEQCRWCRRQLIPEIRKSAIFLICINCDRPEP